MKQAKLSDNPLANKSVLVSIETRQLQARKLNREISAEIEKTHQTKGEAGRFMKTLFEKSQDSRLKKIGRIIGDFRTTAYKMTLPWAQDGQRILPTVLLDGFVAEFDKAKAVFDNELISLENEYPSLIEAQKDRLQGLYDPSDYPKASELAGLFHFAIKIRPVPTDGDFRVSISAETMTALQDAIKRESQAVLQEATQTAYSRLHGVVSKMADALEVGEHKVFRNSLVGNVSDLCDIIDGLNISGDNELERLSAKVRSSLANVTPEELRNEPVIREAAKVEARAISNALKSKMDSFTGSD